MSVSGVIALNHVGISVADLDRAREFWIDGLGAHDHGGFSWPVGTGPADESLATPDTAADVALLRTDAAFLELFAFSSPPPAVRPADAPGIAALTWAVADLDQTLARLGADSPEIRCPDGTPISLTAAGTGPRGLVGVTVRVADAPGHVLAATPGPVRVDVVGGAAADPARPVDLGANHICLDVAGIAEVRAAMAGTHWHHPVTESSGGIAAVCYGTREDGVLVELLESRSEEAFLSRARLAAPEG